MSLRASGILLHISSLPSAFGIGDLGPEAYQFVDFLEQTQQTYWQILPLNPTEGICQHSPYSSPSAFAGNPLLISPERLVKEEFLLPEDISEWLDFTQDTVDYRNTVTYKQGLLSRAYSRFKTEKSHAPGWQEFLHAHTFWLEDYALFVVLKKHFGGMAWTEWPEPLKYRDQEALAQFIKQFQNLLEEVKFSQYLFFRQWHDLKTYCHQKGVKLVGDIPIYVTGDSVDVWKHPQYFKLDEALHPYVVAGVPPDYFSETGQRWGNPVYDWDRLKDSGYQWWIKRIKGNLELFDIVRIDHFRGLVNYWEIPVAEETAMNGYWVDIPTDDFFQTLKSNFGNELPIVAEDLGIITDEVRAIMKRQGFPGMKILLFAFGDDMQHNPYLPHNYTEDCIVYTGTHDNNTVQGWFRNEAGPQEKENFFHYIGRKVPAKEIHWAFIELAMNSSAQIAMIPMQDILGLSQKARMNKPATLKNNWTWRLITGMIHESQKRQLKELTESSGRGQNTPYFYTGP